MRLNLAIITILLCTSFSVLATQELFDDLEVSALGLGDLRQLSKQRESIAVLAHQNPSQKHA